MNTKLEEEIGRKHFRVAIFGSARIKKGDLIHELVYTLAKMISERGMDIVTGGGPGLMNAASEGHHAGREGDEAHSVGLRIKLPLEDKEATHLDVKKEFYRFSNRLDTFVQLSNAVVVAPGGVGTLFELFYVWQLMQVEHICNIPIILLGDQWLDLIRWIKQWPLKNRLLDIEDVDLLFLAKNCREAFTIIEKAYEAFGDDDKNFCLNYKRYKI